VPGPHATGEDEEQEPRGLHAKVVYVEHSQGRTLWLGSANATSRAWDGPNVEVIGALSVGAAVSCGLDAFLETGRIVEPSTLPAPQSPEHEDELLEEARKHVVANWQVVQRWSPNAHVLIAERPPHPPNKSIQLAVGPLNCAPVIWPRGVCELNLLPLPIHQITELVQVQLTLGSRLCTWIQRAPLDPPVDEERDRRAMARYLDPRTFLLWIRSLLDGGGTPSDGGGDWDTRPRSRRPSTDRSSRPTWWAPTLEELLKSWSRDPRSFGRIDREIRNYLRLIQSQHDEGWNEEDIQLLSSFTRMWRVVRSELLQRPQVD
jgi:hypothetical protein